VSDRWRLFCFVVLGALLVFGLERLTIQDPISEDQVQPEQNVSATEETSPHEPEMEASLQARVIPVYDRGTLYTPEQSQQIDVVESEPEPAPRKPPQPPPTPTSFTFKDGERPFIEMDYDAIGFNEYLDAVGKIGRFFVLVKTTNGRALGPEILLRDRMGFKVNGSNAKDFSAVRAHLVSDPRIRQRLIEIELPKNVLRDRVVLIFSKSFDALLWNEIGQSIARRGLDLSAILTVRGSYHKDSSGIFLKLMSAITKNGNHTIPLGKILRI
jgi:hypothetical protein